MSENRVYLGERVLKKIELPESGAMIELYASLTVGDLQGFDPSENGFDTAINILPKIIKSWNIFAGENSDTPEPINKETISKLPVKDLTFLMGELESFASSQKKSS